MSDVVAHTMVTFRASEYRPTVWDRLRMDDTINDEPPKPKTFAQSGPITISSGVLYLSEKTSKFVLATLSYDPGFSDSTSVITIRREGSTYRVLTEELVKGPTLVINDLPTPRNHKERRILDSLRRKGQLTRALSKAEEKLGTREGLDEPERVSWNHKFWEIVSLKPQKFDREHSAGVMG